MIDYVIAYLSIGAGLLAATFLYVLIRDRHKGFEFPRESPWIMLIVLLAIICFWPAILTSLTVDYFKGRLKNINLPSNPEARREFSVERQHLVRRMSVTEIETSEHVYDPAGAVPDLPFGHLHAIWRDFSEKFQPDDEVWKFEGNWQSDFGAPSRIRGYAVVRNGEIACQFVSGRYRIQVA